MPEKFDLAVPSQERLVAGAVAGAEVLESLVEAENALPPSAADRDAAKRAEMDGEEVLTADDFVFRTRQVSDWERAAAIAALTALRVEETHCVKRVERVERQPWRRSQRTPRRIEEFLDG
ncbi:MAG: hypothetical protein Q4C71_02400 [Microbacteriaceae bacterium]|nr:hypothetical protein [Microbacteriaceae bacterium]